jgi:hypothetical protein
MTIYKAKTLRNNNTEIYKLNYTHVINMNRGGEECI